jgi:hypothetical protein
MRIAGKKSLQEGGTMMPFEEINVNKIIEEKCEQSPEFKKVWEARQEEYRRIGERIALAKQQLVSDILDKCVKDFRDNNITDYTFMQLINCDYTKEMTKKERFTFYNKMKAKLNAEKKGKYFSEIKEENVLPDIEFQNEAITERAQNISYSEWFTQSMMSDVADTQREIFECAEENGYEMEQFAYLYMISDFCNREMDSASSCFHYKSGAVCLPKVEYEYREEKKQPLPKGESRLDNAGWVGAMYRYLVFELGISSKDLVKKLPPGKLDDLYDAYELYNTEDAVKDIIKEQGLQSPATA